MAMEVSPRLSSSLEEIKLELEKLEIKLEPYVMGSQPHLLPIETAFKITGIPLSENGEITHEVSDALRKIITPERHHYSLETRYTIGAYSLDSSKVRELLKGEMPPDVDSAIKLLVKQARENDERLKIYNDVLFKTAEVRCFPREWNWGKNP